MEIRLYKQFVKMIDETKRPSGAYVSKDVRLKEDTSIMSPTFLLSNYDEQYNYFYVPKWGRYYFAADCTLNIDGLFELSGEFDHLASYKDSIGAYTCFVERSASLFDVDINDPIVTAKQPIYHRQQINNSISGTSATGCFLLRIKASDSVNGNGINTYAVSKSSMNQFLNDAYDKSKYPDVFADVENEVLTAIFDPFDYVVSCVWVPFSAETFSNKSYNERVKIKCGWWTTDAYGYPITHDMNVIGVQIPSPLRFHQDFRDFNPLYTQVQIYLPGVGLVDLDPRYMCYEELTDNRLIANYCIDVQTGDAVVYLNRGNATAQTFIAKYNAKLSAPVQLAQTIADVGGTVAGALTTLGAIASGNIPMAVVSGVNAIGNLIQPTTQSNGATGSRAEILAYMDVYIVVTNCDTKQIPINKGRMLCQNVRLGTLSGYIQCAGASIDNIAGTLADKERINNSLNSGFYFT